MYEQSDHMQIKIYPTPNGSFSDEMLPLLGRKNEQTLQPKPNLDILLSKFLNNDALNDIELQQLNER